MSVRFTIYCYCCLSVSYLCLLNNIDVWPILFGFRFFSVSFFLFADVFQSEMWSEFFSSIPEHLQPTASLVKAQFLDLKRMVLYVPTWEVLDDGNVGPHPIMSASFLLIPFRLLFIYTACFKMLILLLQSLTPFIVLTGRSRWLAYLKSPIIPWFP